MKRLLMMWFYQLLLPSIAGAFLGAALFAMMNWTATKAILLGALPLLVLTGTAVGYVKGRPTLPTGDDPPTQRAIRGLAGSLLGLIVFSTVGLSVGALALYGYGLLGNEITASLFEDWLPAAGTAGGGVGLIAGYVIAH